MRYPLDQLESVINNAYAIGGYKQGTEADAGESGRDVLARQRFASACGAEWKVLRVAHAWQGSGQPRSRHHETAGPEALENYALSRQACTTVRREHCGIVPGHSRGTWETPRTRRCCRRSTRLKLLSISISNTIGRFHCLLVLSAGSDLLNCRRGSPQKCCCSTNCSPRRCDPTNLRGGFLFHVNR